MKAIEARSITKKYGDVIAVNEVSLNVEDGGIYGLIGPDGAGKTTLIRILTSLLYPESGSAMVLGLDPVREYKKLRKLIGYMPGKFSLYQDLSVEENLQLFASLHNTTIKENYHLIRDIYSQIEPFRKRKAGALSGGMKQKLALSCAMIHKPEILFLDEPTTGVDPVSRKEFWEMLKNLNEDGLTILVSTPYMDEARQCHTIGLMQHGKIMAVDSPENVTTMFKKDLFEIKGQDKYKLLKSIREYQGTDTVYSFGSSLHYTDRSGDFQPRHLEKYLEKQGIAVVIEKISPTVEDTFMALMR